MHFSERTTNLLKACLLSGKRAEEAFVAWRPYATPEHLSPRERRLMPYLLENLQTCGLNDPCMAWIAGQIRYTWAANMVRQPKLLAGIRKLREVGLPFSLIKGAALRVRWPELMTRRQMGDWDVLVRREDARWCLYQLQTVGWKSALPEFLTDIDLDRFHALGLGGPYYNHFDVHWRPAEAISDQRYTSEVMARSVAGKLGDELVSIASITDHLFILFAHAFHDTIEERMDWVAEAATLLRRSPAVVWDWPLFGQLSARYHLESWNQECLRIVAELSDVVLPGEALHYSGTGLARRLQDLEICGRGDEARTPRGQSARRNGIRARGTSPISMPVSPDKLDLEPQLLRALEKGLLTPIRPVGIDLGRVPMGPSFLDGWSIPEAAGRWSDGPKALIALDAQDFAADESISICLDFHAHNNPNLAFSCCAGGVTNGWSFASGHGATDQLIVEGKVIVASGRRIVLIRFDFEGLFDIQARRGHGYENRALGIFLRRLTFAPQRYAGTLEKPVYADTQRSNAVLFSGWSYPEAAGRWSMGRRSVMRFRLPSRPLKSVGLAILQYFSPQGSPMILSFSGDGHDLGSVELPSGQSPFGQGGYFQIELPPGAQAGELTNIEISTDAELSPQRIGLSEDPRPLGFYLGRIDPIYLN